jgi:hypothetical protein
MRSMRLIAGLGLCGALVSAPSAHLPRSRRGVIALRRLRKPDRSVIQKVTADNEWCAEAYDALLAR